MRKAVFLSSAITGVLALLFAAVAQTQDTPKTLALVPTSGPLKGKPVYAKSHALLVGVNRYPSMPGKDLQFALNDVLDMADVLVKSYGFRPDYVRILTDAQASLAGIKAALVDLADSRRVGPEDRVLVYFSGHGQTVKLGAGGEMGFLIPHDAKVDLNDFQNAAPYLASCLPMSQLWDYLGPSAAKHILVIADSCYSGLLAQSRGRERISEDTLSQLAVTRARQVMTAGQKGQVSFELAQVGHGAFTAKMLERLKARAAEDDVFTAAELHADVQIAVSNLSKGKQQPVIGSYDTEGQFLFIPVAWTGPAFSAQELIAKPTQTPESVVPDKPKAPDAQSRVKRIGAVEITLPPGWEMYGEVSQTASLRKPEINDSGGADHYLKVTIRDVNRLWKQRPSSSWNDFSVTLVEEALRTKANLVEDGGYIPGKTDSGLDLLTRKTIYKVSGKNVYWDHYGIHGSKMLALVYLQTPNQEIYKKLEPEIKQILNSIRLVAE